jgi:ABC-2 type transport system ATP-binding protein
MSEYAIVIKELSKTFKIPLEKPSGIKQVIASWNRRNKGYREFHVLKDISFEIRKGEFFGIVGRNGSGKSTLLKLLSGIYAPDKGLIQVNGGLTPFIELGVGFNPELSGRENVFMNGALLGFSHKEISLMYKDIVEFAELKEFMDEKLKNYSSGMQVRLAFSIAIRAKSDILIMDEVLAVGDAVFQKKCYDVFRELKRAGRTIVLVTHDMANVERFCDRALVLNKGEILDIAEPHEAAMIYNRLNIEGAEQQTNAAVKSENRWGTGEVKIQKPRVVGARKGAYHLGDELIIEFDIERGSEYKELPILVGLAIFNSDGVVVGGPNSKGVEMSSAMNVRCRMPDIAFAPGDYKVTLALFDENGDEAYDFLDKRLSFTVLPDRPVHGVVDVNVIWDSK